MRYAFTTAITTQATKKAGDIFADHQLIAFVM